MLIGHEAIEFAANTGRTLNKFEDPIEDARTGLGPDEAREIAKIDPSLIWLSTCKCGGPSCGWICLYNDDMDIADC